jgi:hypothetical protein
MALTLFLPEADAHLFVKLLRKHVPEISDRHSEEGARVWIEKEVFETEDGYLASVRSEDGWTHRMIICLHHPKILDPTVWTSEDKRYESGYIPIEVTPLGPDIYAPNIHVSIDFDPLYEAPEIVLLFLELFEPIENAWGGVMKQLEEQSAVLREAIEEKYMMSRERVPTVEDVSAVIEATEWVETPKPTPPFAADRVDQQPEKPPMPEKPDQTPVELGSWDPWFDYYYAMKGSRYKYTLKRMSEDTGYSHGYIRQLKMEYDRAHKDPTT